MSGGKPAARMGDMTKFGGPIVQDAMGVMIGAPHRHRLLCLSRRHHLR